MLAISRLFITYRSEIQWNMLYRSEQNRLLTAKINLSLRCLSNIYTAKRQRQIIANRCIAQGITIKPQTNPETRANNDKLHSTPLMTNDTIQTTMGLWVNSTSRYSSRKNKMAAKFRLPVLSIITKRVTYST